MKIIGLLLLCCLMPVHVISAQNKKAVTSSQINGLYTYRWSDFRILALGHNKLRVQFNGQYMTLSRVPNIGEADGDATIEGNVATFIPTDNNRCKITLTFLRNRLVAKQEGSDADCGFGHNVYATGTYRRIKRGKPKFVDYP